MIDVITWEKLQNGKWESRAANICRSIRGSRSSIFGTYLEKKESLFLSSLFCSLVYHWTPDLGAGSLFFPALSKIAFHKAIHLWASGVYNLVDISFSSVPREALFSWSHFPSYVLTAQKSDKLDTTFPSEWHSSIFSNVIESTTYALQSDTVKKKIKKMRRKSPSEKGKKRASRKLWQSGEIPEITLGWRLKKSLFCVLILVTSDSDYFWARESEGWGFCVWHWSGLA